MVNSKFCSYLSLCLQGTLLKLDIKLQEILPFQGPSMRSFQPILLIKADSNLKSRVIVYPCCPSSLKTRVGQSHEHRKPTVVGRTKQDLASRKHTGRFVLLCRAEPRLCLQSYSSLLFPHTSTAYICRSRVPSHFTMTNLVP